MASKGQPRVLAPKLCPLGTGPGVVVPPGGHFGTERVSPNCSYRSSQDFLETNSSSLCPTITPPPPPSLSLYSQCPRPVVEQDLMGVMWRPSRPMKSPDSKWLGGQRTNPGMATDSSQARPCPSLSLCSCLQKEIQQLCFFWLISTLGHRPAMLSHPTFCLPFLFVG